MTNSPQDFNAGRDCTAGAQNEGSIECRPDVFDPPFACTQCGADLTGEGYAHPTDRPDRIVCLDCADRAADLPHVDRRARVEIRSFKAGQTQAIVPMRDEHGRYREIVDLNVADLPDYVAPDPPSPKQERVSGGCPHCGVDGFLVRDPVHGVGCNACGAQRETGTVSPADPDWRPADTPPIAETRLARDKIAARSDRAFARVVSGEVDSPQYAARLARELEEAEGDYERACAAAGIEPTIWGSSPGGAGHAISWPDGSVTAAQESTVTELVSRPDSLIGRPQVRHGRHEYVELDVSYFNESGDPAGAIFEIAPDGDYSLAAGTYPLPGDPQPPPVYSPPLSEDVAQYAQETAARLIREAPEYYYLPNGEADTRALTRAVRSIMDRPPLENPSLGTLDDESIIEGIVWAINAAD